MPSSSPRLKPSSVTCRPADLRLSPSLGCSAGERPRLRTAKLQTNKRIYRVMKAYGLLLQRHASGAEELRHDRASLSTAPVCGGARTASNWAVTMVGKVRIAFALNCCDREAMGFVATTECIKGEDVRDLMVTAVEQRLGRINRWPETIEWLTDNASGYIAHDTRRFARDRVRATHPARRKPSIKRDGGGVRAHDEARFCSCITVA